MSVYVVIGWPKSGTQSEDADVLGVWASRAAFQAARHEVDELFVIGWGYTMPVEGVELARSLRQEQEALDHA